MPQIKEQMVSKSVTTKSAMIPKQQHMLVGFTPIPFKCQITGRQVFIYSLDRTNSFTQC